MSARDDPFLLIPPPAPGHPRNVYVPRPTVGQLAAFWIGLMLCPPLPLAVGGGMLVWRLTRDRGNGRGRELGALARTSWVGLWVALVALGISFHPAALAVASLALAALLGSLGRHLSMLTRRGSGRPERLGWLAGVGTAVFLGCAGVLGLLVFQGVVTGPILALALGVVAGFAALGFALLGSEIAGFWTPRDRAVGRALERTRIRGVLASWQPWGYRWQGATSGAAWRVIADCSRLPVAVRIEVALPGFPALRIRRRVPEESGGIPLADPILGSTLVVGGADSDTVEALLADGHELVLPLVHGREAVIEHGVIRLDLASRKPWDRPWEWIEPALDEAVALALSLERRRLEAVPRTDEVIRELEGLSRRQQSEG